MDKYNNKSRARAFFEFVTRYPKTILALGTVFILLAVFQLPKIEKDTRVDAFIPTDHPALLYRDKVKRTFGLKDPIVLAVVNDGPNGVFTPETLSLVVWLVDALEGIENVDLDHITALSTENNIIGTPDGMYVEPFMEEFPQTVEEAALIRQALMGFPLYRGSLVSEDGHATLIVLEVLDEKAAAETYENIQAMLAEAPVVEEKLYLAGEAAVGGYWSAVIDRDSRRLQPLAGLVITLLMWLAFRTWRGALLPLLVVAATALGAIGTMAATGVPYFAITNALPVILIGIAVADSIHILSQYYEERSLHLKAGSRELVLRAMDRMWRPVTVTSLTTMAGFWGIAISSLMPPMVYFGLFAMLGVAIAWAYSLLVLPAALSLLKVGSSTAYRVGAGQKETPETREEVPLAPSDKYGRSMAYIGLWATRNAQLVCVLVLVIVALGVYGAFNLKVDRSRIANINTSDPLYAADQEINKRFDGTNYIDIVVEADQAEGLYQPVNLAKIEALQSFVESQPHVNGSSSIVDYLKQMHRAMSGGESDAYRLPQDENLIAQYFLLYSATGDPTDFEEEIDYDYQTANVRVFIDSGTYSDGKVVVEALQTYIDQHFAGAGLSANLSGRITVDYHWINPLARSHFLSVITALGLVLVMASVMFRSVGAGAFAVIPVAFAVLLIYAVMGLTGIHLEPSTSMFAAIAIGLGVDFSIHTVERMIVLIREQNRPVIQAMALLFPSTGRALFFNFAAIFFGFSTLLFSELPTIFRFGSFIAVAVSAGFLASLFVLPALVVVLNPSFLRYRPEPPPQPEGLVFQWGGRATGAFLLVVLLAMGGLGIAHRVYGEELPSGQEIARHIDNRREGEILSQKIVMTLTNRSGKQRSRDTQVFRQKFEDQERLAIYFENPSRLKGTAFLTWDFHEPATEDAQWLYLPAARKVRRISAADRGDYFLGTDFTYEDIKKETKLGLEDYDFQTLGVEQRDGVDIYKLEAVPRSPALVKELGYSRLEALVRADIWMPITVDYWDRSGRHLKTVTIGDVSEHQGIWTAFRIEAANHKTGHHTLFEYQEVSYSVEFDTGVFTEQGLRRGL